MIKIKRAKRIKFKRCRIKTSLVYINETNYITGTHIHNLNFCQNVRNPTNKKLMEFLASDDTNKNVYVNGEFMCGDFATQCHNNARKAGIRGGLVETYKKGNTTGHLRNAWNTTDKGIVFTSSESMIIEVPLKINYSEYEVNILW